MQERRELAAILRNCVEIDVVVADLRESVADRGDLRDVGMLAVHGFDESCQENGCTADDFDTVLVLNDYRERNNGTFSKMDSRVGQISLFEKLICSSRSISTMLAIERKTGEMTSSETLFKQFTNALGIPRSTKV